MGGIDLDPFSCELANRVIGAGMIYSPPEIDGYAEEWGDGTTRVFVNPDGERVKRKPARAPKEYSKPGQAHGWWKLLDEYEAGRVREAFFVSFNMNLFQTAQRWGYDPPHAWPFCVPRARLGFWGADCPEDESDPSHASAIIYLPPHGEYRKADTFARAAQDLGACRVGLI